jgi:hypothetical protein
MTPGTIFISHRAEYGRLVRELKKAIEQTSRGKIEVFISEDIPRGEMWRTSIEDHLQKSESLFLLYGAQVGRVGTFNHRAAVDDRPDRPGR